MPHSSIRARERREPDVRGEQISEHPPQEERDYCSYKHKDTARRGRHHHQPPNAPVCKATGPLCMLLPLPQMPFPSAPWCAPPPHAGLRIAAPPVEALPQRPPPPAILLCIMFEKFSSYPLSLSEMLLKKKKCVYLLITLECSHRQSRHH